MDAWNGTTNLQADDNNGDDILTMTKVGGGAFSLNSLHLGEGFGSAVQGATQIRIIGTPAVGPPIILDVLMDGIFDAGGPGVDFQTVLFGAAWSNLLSVSFDGIAGPSIRTFLLDNIEVDQVAVPEPASMLLIGTGLAGLAARRYRRKQS